MFRKKKQKETLIYDRERTRPALKSSICTGEKVAGFVDKSSGKFEDIMLIRGDGDLEEFCRNYGISRDEIEKIW
ncbi:MAG: aspartate dehydrogenase [Eubacteriales bacterium]|nr:aspartate dehydrogenase [Eubacteriales bacterium]